MRNILVVVVIATLSTTSFGQRLTFEDWQDEAKSNTKLLPKYGERKKSQQEIKSDKEFEKKVMESFTTKREASDHMINLGFQYLYKGDLKTAMYRFNQAYLLDNDNPNIYWGYGAVYTAFGKFDRSRIQYEEGLKLDKKNENILIDYGTTYLGEFYDYYEHDKAKANELLDKAIEKLLKAYEINPKNTNSSYKLSICYLYKEDCLKANEYLSISEDIGNPNITAAFKNELEEKCRDENLNCSSIKTGKFKISDESAGLTIIERTPYFQIEENTKHGYKLKLKVTWINDCTYQLEPVEDLLNPENKNLPKMILTCTITEITNKGYIQISTSDINPTRIKAEVIEIE